MRTFRIFITAFFLLCSVSAVYAQGQALVTFKAPEGIEITSESVVSGPAREFVNSIAESLGARVTVTYGSLSAAAGGRRILAMVVSDSKTTDELIRDLRNHPNVLSASPNHTVRLMH